MKAGDELLQGARFERLEIDALSACISLRAGGREVRFEDVRATTLLGPWDGSPGTVEWLRVVAADGGDVCLELRVRWREVPRVYRIVCARVVAG